MFVVGGHQSHTKTELLSLTSLNWELGISYPNAQYIHSAKVLFYNDGFYIFEAISDNNINSGIVFKYNTNNWYMIGITRTKRKNYSVTLLGNYVYIVGGNEKYTNEKCEISNFIACDHIGSTETDAIQKP